MLGDAKSSGNDAMSTHPKIEVVSKKVKWEWNMLRGLEYENRTRKENTVIDNALLDSFLLHARVLYDFFCKAPSSRTDADGDPDDVVAQQFFDDPSTWQAIADELLPTVRSQQIELNKHLAHLTYTRLQTKIQWNITEMFKEFAVAWKKFLESLPNERRCWFDGQGYDA